MFNIELVGYTATAIGVLIMIYQLTNQSTIIETTPENFRIFLFGLLATLLWAVYHGCKSGMSLVLVVSLIEVVYSLFVLRLFLKSNSNTNGQLQSKRL